MQRNQKK